MAASALVLLHNEIAMFLFFSGKLGCILSLVISLVASLLMIALLRACTGVTVW